MKNVLISIQDELFEEIEELYIKTKETYNDYEITRDACYEHLLQIGLEFWEYHSDEGFLYLDNMKPKKSNSSVVSNQQASTKSR
jgi:hypothetical protein